MLPHLTFLKLQVPSEPGLVVGHGICGHGIGFIMGYRY